MIVRGSAYVGGDVVDVDIKVEDGFIVDIVKSGMLEDEVIYSFGGDGYLILPAMVDLHVHLRDFDYGYKEDFYSGTASAAAGGVGVVADMPNTSPYVDSLSVLYYRDRVASLNALVDYGLYCGVPKSFDSLIGYESLAIGVKIYPRDFVEEEEVLTEVFRYNSRNNLLTVFHPEDPDCLKGSRGVVCEIRAVENLIGLCKEFGLRGHFTHLTSSLSAELLRSSRIGVTSDTCPHYLTLSSDDCRGSYYKVHPPLRGSDTVKKLLNAFSDGIIDAISTDHAPHMIWEKYRDDVWAGFPGLETSLPFLLHLYNRGVISLGRLVDVYSKLPSKILGIDRWYGDIDVGRFASFTVVNLKENHVVDSSRFFSKAKHSPFEGWVFEGSVVATFVRGNLVYRMGEILGRRGFGRNVCRVMSRVES